MTKKFINYYLRVAEETAKLSHDPDRKVGAVLVKDDQIISEGYNGTAPGDDNNCKDENGHTKPEVIHAEMNCILRACRKGISTNNTDLFLTCSPCFNCAKLILLAGIKSVYYLDDWKDQSALNYLQQHKIEIHKIERKIDGN